MLWHQENWAVLLIIPELFPNHSVKDKAIMRHFVDELSKLVVFRQDFYLINKAKGYAKCCPCFVLWSEVKLNGIFFQRVMICKQFKVMPFQMFFKCFHPKYSCFHLQKKWHINLLIFLKFSVGICDNVETILLIICVKIAPSLPAVFSSPNEVSVIRA